jgi:hypothetical protein
MAGGGRPAAVNVLVAVTLAVCLVNVVIGVRATRGIDGTKPAALERRYGGLREPLADTDRVVYLSDGRWRFVEARFALAPVILDPGYVVIDTERRTIASLAIDALAADAAVRAPVIVLCDFSGRPALDDTVDALVAAAANHDLSARVSARRGGVALVTLGG